jgi:hypothetical protein
MSITLNGEEAEVVTSPFNVMDFPVRGKET